MAVPSAARTIKWIAPPASLTRAIAYRWPVMLAGEILDFSLDLSGFLSDDDDTLVSVVVTPPAGSITVTPWPMGVTTQTIWAGPTDGPGEYSVMFTITTTGGRTLDITVILPVLDGVNDLSRITLRGAFRQTTDGLTRAVL